MRESAIGFAIMIVLTLFCGCSGTRMVQMEPGVESSEPKLLSKGGERILGYVGLDGASHAFNGHVRLEGEQLYFQPEKSPRLTEAPLESQESFYVDRNEVDALMVKKLHVGRTIAVSLFATVLATAVVAATVLSFL